MICRFEIHRSQFSRCHKNQYYIWDAKLKTIVADIRKGGMKTAHKIRKVYSNLQTK